MTTNRIHRVAVIPGDGIGQEVMPEGVRVLEAAAKKFGFKLAFDDFDFASCDYYDKHGRMMPEDWKEKIGKHDAIYFGAVGMPDRVPDHISLWGSLILFRREFDQYVNLRPVRLMPGVPSPLAGRKPGDIDFWVVRENTEGEYSSIGGKMFPGTDREVVVQETVMSRIGVDRVLKFAFELAQDHAEEASDLSDQVERHRHHHAVLGRAREGNGEKLSRREMESVSHRHPDRALRHEPGQVQRRRRLQSVRRYSLGSRSGLHRHDRHRAVRQHQSGAAVSVGVRAGARLARRIFTGRASPIRSARSGRAR